MPERDSGASFGRSRDGTGRSRRRRAFRAGSKAASRSSSARRAAIFPAAAAAFGMIADDTPELVLEEEEDVVGRGDRSALDEPGSQGEQAAPHPVGLLGHDQADALTAIHVTYGRAVEPVEDAAPDRPESGTDEAQDLLAAGFGRRRRRGRRLGLKGQPADRPPDQSGFSIQERLGEVAAVGAEIAEADHERLEPPEESPAFLRGGQRGGRVEPLFAGHSLEEHGTQGAGRLDQAPQLLERDEARCGGRSP
ncbi:MAG: hypothetical protein MZU79_06125 [Anaerotruncus sp.]|nr:hypothetical protein [Anaerotruncus sp.]